MTETAPYTAEHESVLEESKSNHWSLVLDDNRPHLIVVRDDSENVLDLSVLTTIMTAVSSSLTWNTRSSEDGITAKALTRNHGQRHCLPLRPSCGATPLIFSGIRGSDRWSDTPTTSSGPWKRSAGPTKSSTVNSDGLSGNVTRQALLSMKTPASHLQTKDAP